MDADSPNTARRVPGIAEHGLIGDMRSAALVGTDASINWYCPGRFDEPSVFGFLLDTERGGAWRMDPLPDVTSRHQFYVPDTNILVTRLFTEAGIVEVEDFMPVPQAEDEHHVQRIIRRVSVVRGKVPMRSMLAPRPDYGRTTPSLELHPRLARFTTAGCDLVAWGPGSWEPTAQAGCASTTFTLSEGERACFALEVREAGKGVHRAEVLDDLETDELFTATLRFWRKWLRGCTYTGRWREAVYRSALTLKLLTHEPSGALIAAPTLGLPEQDGGTRNWDYRYVWIRDAAFSLYALLRLGFTKEADAFFGWLERRVKHCDEVQGPLRAVYSIDGTADLPEEILEHLPGYRGASPVRVGNDAASQLQLDVYGELFDAFDLYDKYGDGISLDTWSHMVDLLGWLLDRWEAPDESIWEVRAGRHHHTFSRLMCWVAVERMIRIARRRGLPADLGRWLADRDRMHGQIIERGWHRQLGSFVQRLAPSPAVEPEPLLDASLLMMPLVKFISGHDARFRSTLRAIEQHLVCGSFVFRYDHRGAVDGVNGTEGTFTPCSFWWIEALTRAGRTDEARLALEQTFSFANHVGQYAEEFSLTGEQMGNFPQALTHLALISAAVNLDRALDTTTRDCWE
ncbi:glycoside hydrolase family 15 protein [Streptomyces sp. NPDC005012]|uniref:glycoside hydrolase family 15 protein n=1 Tax=Streptomyces sp. NPDC005012 TaxID=3154558 RepID=UPI0033A168FC